jgi:hypothetical protein
VGSITTIVVPDAATTPVNHTFSPVKVNGDSAVMLEKSATASLGYWPLTLQQRSPVAGQTEKVYRTKINLAIPVVYTEVINGVNRPSLGYTMRANIEFVIPADATLQNRKDLRKIAVGILNDASTVSMVEAQENLY